MILVVGGTKGGSGKTLLATNLAVIRALSGQDVLLIDADDQASAMLFTRQRQQRMYGKPLYTAIQSFEADVIAQVRNLAPNTMTSLSMSAAATPPVNARRSPWLRRS